MDNLPNHVELSTVSAPTGISRAYRCGQRFAGAASLAGASKQKSRHQAARGALNKLPQATGAHGAPQIPLEGVQGVRLISTG